MYTSRINYWYYFKDFFLKKKDNVHKFENDRFKKKTKTERATAIFISIEQYTKAAKTERVMTKKTEEEKAKR